jgi:hypothetical protein
MQISGVSLTLTWPLRLCLFRVLLGTTDTVTSFPLSKHTGGVVLHQPSLAGLFIYSSRGKWHFPPLQWGFPHTATFTSFPAPRLLGVCRCSCLLWLACLFTVPWGIAPPPFFGTQGTPPSLLCVFCCCLFSLFFSFFPRWGSVCPGGYADLAQGYLWEYHVLLSSPGDLHLSSW